MKTQLLTFSFLFVAVLFANAQNIPKDGAVIRMEDYSLSVKDGQTVTTTVQLVRSTRFVKAKIDGLVVQEKSGVEFKLTPIENLPETYTLQVTPTSIKEGSYAIIIKAEGKMAHKVKQTMFTLKVTGKEPIASTNE
jgi:hypothetical protein